MGDRSPISAWVVQVHQLAEIRQLSLHPAVPDLGLGAVYICRQDHPAAMTAARSAPSGTAVYLAVVSGFEWPSSS